ncbi:MAG: DNA repair protein RecO [Deltaproteobacteria bacterium]|nr:MAG: DNA repair protein RecO [Deltaproteobacteria bacterium]
MSEKVITRALVARSVDYGEADRILTLLTEDGGKVSALARSARRSRKRFGAALSLFVLGRAELGSPRRGSDLRPLARFDPITDLAGVIGADLGKMTHGSYVLELARDLWPSEESDPALFHLVMETLGAIAEVPPSPRLLRCFELRLLAAIGLAPSFDQCVRCGEGIPGASGTVGMLGFSATSGGAICAACGPHGWPLAEDVWREARILGALRPREAASEASERTTALELRELCRLVLRHHLGRELKAWQFLAQLTGGGR